MFYHFLTRATSNQTFPRWFVQLCHKYQTLSRNLYVNNLNAFALSLIIPTTGLDNARTVAHELLESLLLLLALRLSLLLRILQERDDAADWVLPASQAKSSH